MTNNDVLRRIRYIFDISDGDMIGIFALADANVGNEVLHSWLKKEEADGYAECPDEALATFLNGFIVKNRGKKDGPAPKAETWLSNNAILVKLKIALAYRAEDMLAVLQAGGIELGKSELSAFFRKPDHKHFRECKDQVLRNFLKGLQLRLRP